MHPRAQQLIGQILNPIPMGTTPPAALRATHFTLKDIVAPNPKRAAVPGDLLGPSPTETILPASTITSRV